MKRPRKQGTPLGLKLAGLMGAGLLSVGLAGVALYLLGLVDFSGGPSKPSPVAPVAHPPANTPGPASARNEGIPLDQRADVPLVPCGVPTLSMQPQLAPGLRLDGKGGAVHSAVFSPDGRFILSGSEDGVVRLWETATGKEQAPLTGHTGAVHAVLLISAAGTAKTASVGSLAVSGGADGTIRFWDLTTRKETRRIEAHRGAVRALAVAANGKRLLSGGADRACRLWDVESGEPIGEFFGQNEPVLSVSLSPDGQYGLSGSIEGALTWELATGREVNFTRFRMPVRCVRFLPDSKRALLAGDWSSCLWDVLTGQPWMRADLHTTPLHTLALSPDGRLVVGGLENHLVLFALPLTPQNPSPNEFRLPPSFLEAGRAHDLFLTAVDFAPAGDRILSAGLDGIIRLWRPERVSPAASGHDRDVSALAVSAKEPLAVTGDLNGRLLFWDLATGKFRTVQGHQGLIKGLALSHDGTRLYSAGSDRKIGLWDVRTGERLRSFDLTGSSDGFPGRGAFSPDDSQLVCSMGRGYALLDSKTGEAGRRLTDRGRDVLRIGFLSEGEVFVAASDGLVTFNAATGQEVQRYAFGKLRSQGAVVWSRDGRRLWTAGQILARDNGPNKQNEPFVSLWDLTTRTEVVRFTNLPGPIGSLALSSDGRTLVGGGQQTVHVWDTDPPRPRWSMRTRSHGTTYVGFLPGDREFVTARGRGPVERWSVAGPPVPEDKTAKGDGNGEVKP